MRLARLAPPRLVAGPPGTGQAPLTLTRSNLDDRGGSTKASREHQRVGSCRARHVSEARPGQRRPRWRGTVAIREKDLGIWQSYTWRDYFERSPPHRARSGVAGVRAGRQDRHRRRQPARALLGDPRHPGAGRRAGAALPGLDREGAGVHRRPRRGALRGGRGPGAGRQAPARARAVPAPRVHRLRRSAWDARATREPGLLSLAELEERGREVRARPPDVLRRRAGQGRRATTPRSSATRRGPPARPRARCCPTGT